MRLLIRRFRFGFQKSSLCGADIHKVSVFRERRIFCLSRSSRIVPTTSCFWWTLSFALKSDFSLSVTLIRLDSVGLRLITLLSVENYLPVCFKPVDLDHGLARARFGLYLLCGRTKAKTTLLVQLILYDDRWLKFHSELSTRLLSRWNTPQKLYRHLNKEKSTVCVSFRADFHTFV